MQAEKEYTDPYFSIVPLSTMYISKIMWWLPMFDFGIFCYLLRHMGIYRVGAPVQVFEKFRSLFSFLFIFFLFLLFLFFVFFFVSLSWTPLAPGTLDIVHPCHPVATPLMVLHMLYAKAA